MHKRKGVVGHSSQSSDTQTTAAGSEPVLGRCSGHVLHVFLMCTIQSLHKGSLYHFQIKKSKERESNSSVVFGPRLMACYLHNGVHMNYTCIKLQT